MNKFGWIIYNGNLPGEAFLDFAEWLQVAATRKNIKTTIYKNNEMLSYLTDNSITLLKNNTETLPDFVIFTDKDIYLARQLELLGIRVFNSANAIETSDDKISTYQILAENKLAIPKTIIAPKLFGTADNLDVSFLQHVVSTLTFPMIIKEAFGSFGEQVYLVHTMEEMTKKVKELNGKPFVFQEFVTTSYGKDIRLHVVGDRVVATMLRVAKNDFRANVSAGGLMEPYEPNKQECALAVAATKAIKADFAGVDLLFGPNDTPVICEVNSNAHIRNMHESTNINVADFMIEYIIKTLTNK